MRGEKRTRIPSTQWREIAAKHAAGHSYASLAREYGCAPSTIGYILNRKLKGTEDKEAVRPDSGPGQIQDRADQQKRQRILRLISSISHPAPTKNVAMALRRRVMMDIAAFLSGLDAMSEHHDPTKLEVLLETAGQLMRTLARTSIEIEIMLHQPNHDAAPPD